MNKLQRIYVKLYMGMGLYVHFFTLESRDYILKLLFVLPNIKNHSQ